MPYKTRITLFYSFVVLFLIIGTSVLLYSFGWRLDLETLRIRKIGAIYIKANVKNITININGDIYPDDSGIIKSGTLINNLLPKTYTVELTKQGYLPYRKTVTVKPAMVEEILNAQLIPESFTPEIIAPIKGETIVHAANGMRKAIIQDSTSGIFYLYDHDNASSTINLNILVANMRRGEKIKHIAVVPFNPNQFVIEDATVLKLFYQEKRTLMP